MKSAPVEIITSSQVAQSGGRRPASHQVQRQPAGLQRLSGLGETLREEMRTLSKEMAASQGQQAEAMAALSRELAATVAALRELQQNQQPQGRPQQLDA